MVAATQPIVFENKVDLRPIARAVKRYHEEVLHDAEVSGDVIVGIGFFKKISRGIKSIGKSKICKDIARTAKKVVKSKVTGAIVAGAAIAFPPVGLPAAAAYATANAALAAYEKGEKAAKEIKGAVKAVSKAAKTKRAVRRRLLGSPKTVKRYSAKLALLNRVIRTGTGRRKAVAIKLRAKLVAAIKARARSNARKMSAAKRAKVRTIVRRGSRARKKVKSFKRSARRRPIRKAKNPGKVLEARNRIRKLKAKNAKINKRLVKFQKILKTKKDKRALKYIRALRKVRSRNRRQIARLQKAIRSNIRVVRSSPLRERMQNHAKAKKMFRDIAVKSRYYQDPNKKAQYKKVARIFAITAAARQKQKDITSGVSPSSRKGETGLVIDSRGRIKPGEFVSRSAMPSSPKELLMSTEGKYRPGHYEQVGGCIGCY